jgi:hypothetical protein
MDGPSMVYDKWKKSLFFNINFCIEPTLSTLKKLKFIQQKEMYWGTAKEPPTSAQGGGNSAMCLEFKSVASTLSFSNL